MDVSVGVMLVFAVLVTAAGLGVVALLEVAAGAALIASFAVERRTRRRRTR